MKEYIISLSRHGAAVIAGAVVAFLTSNQIAVFEPGEAQTFSAGVEALLGAVALAVYAVVEKLLKPVFNKFFGSEGTA